MRHARSGVAFVPVDGHPPSRIVAARPADCTDPLVDALVEALAEALAAVSRDARA
ncbi:hypothetical protein ACFQ1I_45110 [Kitasatospora arboriphila]